MNRSNISVAGSKPPLQTKASIFCPHVPNTTGTDTTLKEGELRCYECGQKGHIKPQCLKLKGKQRVARMQFEEVVDKDNQMDVPFTGLPNDTPEEVDTLLKEGEDLNEYLDADEDDQPKYNWDDQGYQMNLIHFINEDHITDNQMQVAGGTIDNMVELVYDHCTQYPLNSLGQ